MKLINESVLKRQPQMPKTKAAWILEVEQEERIENQVNQVLKKYKMNGTVTELTIMYRLKLITSLMGDVKGKTVLDIGCGAKQSWDYDLCKIGKERRYYDPWLCRVLQFFGAKTFGIDGGESPNESYTHIQGHLYRFSEHTERFPNHSLDLACAWGLFDSPSLGIRRELFDTIVTRLEVKLKPEGFFVFDASGTGLYSKKDWQAYLRARK